MRPTTLLIDDEEDFVRLLAMRLETRDFPVFTALTAEEGLQAVTSQDPAVVVLDVNLPDMSGLDVLREIRQRRPLVQVVMLTGQSDLNTAIAGMKLGALDYLVKPVDVDVLVEALERATVRRLDQEESLRMIETGKMAMLGKLAEGVAHEINNPVNIILQKAGWAEELLEDAPSSPLLTEVAHELKSIQQQVRRCRAIVGKLMSFGGRIDPRPSEFCLASAVQNVLKAFQEKMDGQGVRVCMDISTSLPPVTMPRAELEQVLHHLLENSLEAMAPGGGHIEISACLKDQAIDLRVTDSGPGIPEHILSRVFEPFFSTKEVGKGSGLGLAICHGIVRSLGGDIEADSPPGHGATISLRLPLPGQAS